MTFCTASDERRSGNEVSATCRPSAIHCDTVVATGLVSLPDPKPTPNADHLQYTRSDICTGWGLGTRLQPAHIARKDRTKLCTETH